MSTRQLTALGTAVVGMALATLAGCHSPLERTEEQELRDQLWSTQRHYTQAIAGSPQITVTRSPSITADDLPEKYRAEGERTYSPEAAAQQSPPLGRDLLGQEKTPVVGMTLQRALSLAARNNLDVKLASMGPAISETQITQAEAVFDAVYFMDTNLQNLNTPRPKAAASFGVNSPFGGPLRSANDQFSTGIRKQLTSGGQVTAQTDFTHNFNNPVQNFNTGDWYTADVLVSLQQPLLRNFGADVTRSQILLSQSARGQAVQDVRTRMLEVLGATEVAYWDLLFAKLNLVALDNFQHEAEVDRDLIKKRLPYDAQPVQLTQADSEVEGRHADVIRARQDVRKASDALKRLVNSPDLPVSSEVVIEPLEMPADVPVTFNLVDAVTTALRHRPELRRALLEIQDATIRQRVADNQRLPKLDLAFTSRINGENNAFDRAYGQVSEGHFVDYLVGVQFETPIGNRAAEGAYRQRQLERQATVIAYQRAALQVVNDVKDAMRELQATYELIGANRAARQAATENLRNLRVKEEAGEKLTPEFIDQVLRSQERLALARTREVQSLRDYNVAIARFYQVLGTLLERNGIDLKDDWKPGTADERLFKVVKDPATGKIKSVEPTGMK